MQHPTGGNANINPTEQPVIGITNGVEATRLAQYLWDKRKYERDTLEISVTDDGILLSPGDLISVTDHLLVEKPLDGEVESFDEATDTFIFDQVIPAGTYMFRIRSNDQGGILSTQVTLTETNQTQVIVTALKGKLDLATAQVGMLYSFIPITDDGTDLFYVLEVTPSRDNPVRISAMNFNDLTYQSDTAVIVQTPATKD